MELKASSTMGDWDAWRGGGLGPLTKKRFMQIDWSNILCVQYYIFWVWNCFHHCDVGLWIWRLIKKNLVAKKTNKYIPSYFSPRLVKDDHWGKNKGWMENVRRNLLLNNVFMIWVKRECNRTMQKKDCEQHGLAARLECIWHLGGNPHLWVSFANNSENFDHPADNLNSILIPPFDRKWHKLRIWDPACPWIWNKQIWIRDKHWGGGSVRGHLRGGDEFGELTVELHHFGFLWGNEWKDGGKRGPRW